MFQFFQRPLQAVGAARGRLWNHLRQLDGLRAAHVRHHPGAGLGGPHAALPATQVSAGDGSERWVRGPRDEGGILCTSLCFSWTTISSSLSSSSPSSSLNY